MKKIKIEYREFRYTEANFNNITWYKDNINSQIKDSLFLIFKKRDFKRIIDVNTVENYQIWEDFTPYRKLWTVR